MKNTQIRKQQRRALMLILLGGLLLIVAAFWIGSRQAATESTAGASIPYPEVARIPLDQARSRFDEGTAIWVDVRDRGDYESAHIPGALSIPLSELPARFQELPLGAEILTYCT